MTTISVKAAEKLERLHRKNGCIYLSGPVVGRPDAAAEGKLKTFLSGDADAIERCKALVESYTEMAFPIGSTASEAISMKICANYMALTQLEMMGELYTVAEKSGLNLDLLLMMFQMAFAEPTLKMYAEKIKNRDFDEAGFDLVGGLKDVQKTQDFSFSCRPLIYDVCRNAGYCTVLYYNLKIFMYASIMASSYFLAYDSA